MNHTIIDAAVLKDHFVFLRFEDGTEGVVDLADIVGKGEIFAPLSDIDFFCEMKLDTRFGSIEWPNGADLSPDSLYETVKQSSSRIAKYSLHS